MSFRKFTIFPENMKKLLFVLILSFLMSQFLVQAQPVNKQAGLRTGYMGGLFFQTTGQSGHAETGLMAMLGFKNNGVQLTGLRLVYQTSLSEISDDLYLVWGYGDHAGFVVKNNISYLGNKYYFRSDRFCPLFGVDGWGAVEYRFRSIPLAVSVNIKPYVELTFPSFINLMPGDVGISISYTF
jgi:hypothetical protein